jgi:hypothetical protein
MYEIIRIWSLVTAPIHELGHMIFGWLSFNPAMITSWNETTAMRYGFMIQIGGYLFDAIFPALLSYRFRRHPWVHAFTTFHVVTMFYSIPYQGDFKTNTTGPMLIWVLGGILSLVVILYSLIAGLQDRSETRKQARPTRA